ncbi:hypothetical protein ACJX0J_013797, partial [Zea mays]
EENIEPELLGDSRAHQTNITKCDKRSVNAPLLQLLLIFPQQDGLGNTGSVLRPEKEYPFISGLLDTAQ